MKQKSFLAGVFSLFIVAPLLAQVNIPFKERKKWDGPLDIKMIAAPNLQGAYVHAGTGNVLIADSLVRYSTMLMSGTLLDKNNQYKGGSPFNSVSGVPQTAFACKDVNAACMSGFDPPTAKASCPGGLQYQNPATQTVLVSMTYADYDDDLSTYSSSMAFLDISKCSTVESAYLYWSGDFQGSAPDIILNKSTGGKASSTGPPQSYNGNGDVFNISATSPFNKVKLKVPGGTYQDVTATTVYTKNSTYAKGPTNSYVCVADVTTLVNGSSGGQFWVANIQSYPNEGDGGSTSGWTLVVVFSSPLSPPRAISLWDGMISIGGDSDPTNSTDITLTGLQAPATSDFRSYVGFAALDGENTAAELLAKSNATPEGIDFTTNGTNPKQSTINPFCDGSQPQYKRWTKKGYPGDNAGNDLMNTCKMPNFDPGQWVSVCDGVSSSHITSYSDVNKLNGNEIVRLPSNPNTLGYDSHHFILPDGAVATNATQATLTVNSGPQGGTTPFMAYIAIERLQPKLVLTKKADKDQTTTGVSRSYTLKIVNAGNEDSFGGDVLLDTLDLVTKYKANSTTSTKYVSGTVSTGGIAEPTITSTSKGQALSFSIPVIKKKDSLEITFSVDVLPVTDAVAGPLYTNQCKRTILNTAWITYRKNTNVPIETITSKSNSGECNDGSEVKILITGLGNAPTALNTVDASSYRDESITKHVRQEIVSQGHAPAADTSGYLIYDSNGNRIYSFDAFPATGGSATYTAYRDLSGASCQDVISITFTFCTVPATPTAPSVAAICAGSTAQLSKTGSAVGTYFWYSSSTGGTPQANPFTTPALTQTTTYYLIDSSAISHCASARRAVTVTVNALPSDPTAPTVTAICSGNTATFNKTGTATGMFIWYTAPTGGIPQSNPFTSPLLTANTTYYLMDSAATGCKSARVPVTVTVNANPNAPTAPSIAAICSGNKVTLTATGTATGAFIWYIASVGGSPHADPYTSSSALTANSTFYLMDSVASTGCKSGRTPVSVTVNPVIDPGKIGTSASICSGTSITIAEITQASGGNGTFSYTWKSSSDGTTFTALGAPDATTYSNSSGIASTTYYLREVSSGTCTAQTSNVVKMTVLPSLDPGAIAGTTKICYNGNANLSSTADASGGVGTFSYQWENSADGSSWNAISSATTTTYNATALTATAYFRRKVVSGTGTCNTSYSNIDTVTVYPDFTSGGTIQVDKATICANQQVGLSNLTLPTGGTGSYTYAWSQSDGSANTSLASNSMDGGNITLSPITKTVYTFTRTATSGTCGSKTASVTVTVNPTIAYTVKLDPVADICSSDPTAIVFSATATPSNIGATGSYTWSLGGGTETTSTGSLSKSPSVLTNGEKVKVTLVPSADVCPAQSGFDSNELTLVVANKVIPTINMPTPDAVCAGTSVTFTAAAQDAGPSPTYSWTIQGSTVTGTTILPDTSQYTYVPANGDKITVTVTSNSSCKSTVPSEQIATATVTMTIKPLVTPALSIIADKLNPCQGDSVTFHIDTKTNEGSLPTFTWYVGTGLQSGTSPTFKTATLSGTQTITAHMVSNAECVDPLKNPAVSNEVAVTVTPRVVPKTSIFAQPSGTVCAGEPVTFSVAQSSTDTANGGSAVAYEWRVGSSTVLGTGPTFTSSNLQDQTIVSVHYISSLRCLVNDNKVATGQMTVRVNTPAVSISGLTTFCSDDTAGTLQAVDNGSGTDQVTHTGPTFTWTTSTGTFSGSTIKRSKLTDGETVKVQMTPGYTCHGTPASASQLITIYTKPTANMVAYPVEICPGQTADLVSSSGSMSGSTLLSYTWFKDDYLISGSTVDTLAASEEGNYKVRIANGLPTCYSEATQSLLVQDVVVNAGPDKTMYQGDSVKLEGSSNGNYQYVWKPSHALSDTTILQPIARPQVSLVYVIKATSSLGCTATDEVLVEVFVPIKVPNAFSPNGDGLNDNWVIDGMEKFPNSKVNVFNRWGNSIYTDNNGYRAPWDGMHNGQHLPTGTYYYIIDLKGSPDHTDRTVTGSLTIVK